MSRTLIIFDFDGTIADTAKIVMDVGNEVLAEYGMKQVDASRFEEMRSKTATELMREFRVPLYKVPSIVTSIRRSLKSRMDVLEPVDGMIEMLRSLSEQENVELAVMSSNSLENVAYFLNKHDFRELFSFMYGDVGVFSKYTKIRRISRSEGKGARVISVGDEVRDVEAAKIARVDFIGVDWGMNSPERLKAVGAKRVVSNVGELRAQLDELLRDEK